MPAAQVEAMRRHRALSRDRSEIIHLSSKQAQSPYVVRSSKRTVEVQPSGLAQDTSRPLSEWRRWLTLEMTQSIMASEERTGSIRVYDVCALCSAGVDRKTCSRPTIAEYLKMPQSASLQWQEHLLNCKPQITHGLRVDRVCSMYCSSSPLQDMSTVLKKCRTRAGSLEDTTWLVLCQLLELNERSMSELCCANSLPGEAGGIALVAPIVMKPSKTRLRLSSDRFFSRFSALASQQQPRATHLWRKNHMYLASAVLARRAAHVVGAHQTRFLSSLEALKVVRLALRDGHDAEFALQTAMGVAPPDPQAVTVILPTGDTQDIPVELDEPPSSAPALAMMFDPAGHTEFAKPVLGNLYSGTYPRLALHALLHGHIRAGRLVEASALAYTQLRSGNKIAPQSLEVLVECLCPPPSTIPGPNIQPTIELNPAETDTVFGEDISRLNRDLDLGTAMARLLVSTAREEKSPTSFAMYKSLIGAVVLQQRMALAGNIFGILCKDWQLHLELLRRKQAAATSTERVTSPETAEDTSTLPSIAPITEDSTAATLADDAAEDATADPNPTQAGPDDDIPYDPPFTEDEIAEAESLGFATIEPPFPSYSLMSNIVRAILYPRRFDMNKPDKPKVAPPEWDKDAIITIFLLVELLERRRLPFHDIAILIQAASAALNAGVHGVPVKIYRGGQLHRVKAQNHIESVIRQLLREPPIKERQTGEWDLLLPLDLNTYNALLAFGLERKVPGYELESLIEGMVEQGLRSNDRTVELLFRRAKLSQNKIVSRLLEILKSAESTQTN